MMCEGDSCFLFGDFDSQGAVLLNAPILICMFLPGLHFPHVGGFGFEKLRNSPKGISGVFARL